MKRFTSLMLMLLCAVTSSWAFTTQTNITDLASLTDGSYVCFYNVGRQNFVYEASNKHMSHGNSAADLTYVWQVHVEADGKYSFSSITGYYVSTPLDGQAVYTVEETSASKDKFTITAHNENTAKWKLQSSNDTGMYWDGQVAQFVGWYGSGTNSQFEIIPVTVEDSEIEAYQAIAFIAECNTIISNASTTLVGAYTPDAVSALSAAVDAYEADATSENLNAVKSAYNDLLESGATVTLGANEAFKLKCVDTNRGYMAYSTVEGKGSETQVYLAGTNNSAHAATTDEGVYMEWAMVVNEGKNYIYNVQNKKFISADAIVKFTETPAALNLLPIGNCLYEVQFESTNKYLSFSPGWGADCVRTESGTDEGCYFYIEKSGETVDIETIAAVETTFVNGWKEAMLAKLGSYVGHYSEDLRDEIEAVSTLAGTAEFEATYSPIAVSTDAYYRIVCVSPKTDNNGDTNYNTLTFDGSANLVTAPESASSINQIFKFEDAGDGKFYLKSMNADGYLNKISAGSYRSIIVSQTDACKIELINYSGVQWRLHNSESSNSTHCLFAENHPTETVTVPYACAGWESGANSASAWYIVPATDIEIAVNTYASVYLPFAVSVEGATAYAVENTYDTYVTLTEKSDIPANKGAILATEGEATVTLNILAEAESDWTNNKLQGSTIDTYVEGVAYVLANGNNGIGLYKTMLNVDENGATGETHFKNNANKAYLPAAAGASNVACYSFRFGEGTTGVEKVEIRNENGEIFDLTGRKVNSITAPGIYIVGGKKVLVK